MAGTIVNDYNNTEELLKKFPIINETPVESEMEKRIQNRLLTGFENWNRGFDAWKEWGDILYTPESLYNVHSVKLSLSQYQMAMMATLKANDIQMGDFLNMVVCDDWTAIHYKIATINRETGSAKDGSVMEFVHFGEMGDELGCRVIEGWAGTKGDDFSMLSRIQGPDLLEEQNKVFDSVVNAEIPDTDNLVEKYPVVYPTPMRSEIGELIRDAILKDFDAYNNGFDAWNEASGDLYTDNYKHCFDDKELNLDAYRGYIKDQLETNDIKRVCFDSLLISGDWAAIHYRMAVCDKTTGEKTPADTMQFIHFVKDGDKVKADQSIVKC